jgi:hypothetical protein
MMQGPPADLFRPQRIEEEDSWRDLSGLAWLGIVVAVTTLAVFLALNQIHAQHAWHGDRAATKAFLDCSNAAFDKAITTGVDYDADACKPVMPWYAAHPGWYALAVGAVVAMLGRVALFMARMERSRGR